MLPRYVRVPSARNVAAPTSQPFTVFCPLKIPPRLLPVEPGERGARKAAGGRSETPLGRRDRPLVPLDPGRAAEGPNSEVGFAPEGCSNGGFAAADG